MTTIRMAAEEFKAAAAEIVGRADRGWKKEAAAALNVSVVTISNALKNGPGLPLTEKTLQALEEKRAAGVTVGLPADVGPWVIGEPEMRRRDGLTDVVVMHMNKPRMTMHARQRRDASKAPEFFIEWHESTASAAFKAKIIREARKKALSKIHQIIETRIVAGARERHVKGAIKAAGYDRVELDQLSQTRIAALARGAGDAEFLMRERKILEAEAQQAISDINKITLENRVAQEAFEIGSKHGKAKVLGNLAYRIEIDAAADAEALYTAKILQSRAHARAGVVRGKVVDRMMHRSSEFDKKPDGRSGVVRVTRSRTVDHENRK